MRITRGHPLYERLMKQAGLFHSKRHKYNAKRTTVNGIAFPSKLEADTYRMLLLLEKVGLIRDIRLQDPVRFMTYLGYSKVPKAETYKIDFAFFHNEYMTRTWCESKGIRTDRWIRCERLWKMEGPGPLYIVTSKHYSRNGEIRLPAEPVWPNGKAELMWTEERKAGAKDNIASPQHDLVDADL